jgi:steroid 5-alpha reductase family enzyme
MASILSLPVLKVAEDCADFSLTVRPYIPQLLDLPNQLAAIASSTDKIGDLGALYLNTNPLVTAFAFSLLISPIFLIVSEINRNYSQVDRLWSILPLVYISHYTTWAHKNGLPTQRLDNIVAFAAIWSIRLTYNYWRKGGYSIGSEDYRWMIVKEKVGPVVMFLFNVTFISFIQSVCICAHPD